MRKLPVLLGIATLIIAGLPDTTLGNVNERVGASSRLEHVLPAAQQPGPRCEALDAGQCLAALRSAVLGSPVRKDPLLAWPLVQLVEADSEARALGQHVSGANLPKTLRDLNTAKLMRINETGSVQVFIHADGSAPSLVPALEAAGAKVERVAEEYGILQAWVPTRQLRSVAATPGVKHVRLPDYGFPAAGSVTTEGDALLNAANARSTFGIDGSGVRVGVISDGVEGLAGSQASGDLPSVNTTTCNMVPQSPTSSGAGAEGTAMLEIVHDLAPGAELWFGHSGLGFSGTVLDFMAAVSCLAQNVDIVVDDIGFFNNGAYDGTSPVSLNASAALNGSGPIRGYYNAVGNQADVHYEEPFVDSGAGFHRFAETSGTLDLAGIGPRSDNPIIIPAGATAVILLQWNDPFGGSCNDYDLRAWVHNATTLIAQSIDPQTCSQDPTERLVLDNTFGSAPWVVDITIENFAANPRTFDMFLLRTSPNFLTPCSSVSNNSDAGGGVVSLGAINAADPGANDIEPFSSCGPTNDGRLKPDAAAIDGVSVTGNGGFPSPFFGTSAAAPHAAAVAALLLECDPNLTRTQLRDALLNTAVDLGSLGPDNDFGYGRLDALAAAASAGCAAPTATPTPTVTPAITPTAGATGTPTLSPTPCPLEVCTPTPSPTPLPGAVSGNDDFADAWIISSLPFVGQQSTVGMTTQPGEPLNPDGCITVQPQVMGHTVWYRFTAPESGTASATTSGSGFDTVLAAYAGDAVDALTPLACNDDDSPVLQSLVSFPVTAGTTYYIQVGGFSAAAGELSLNVSLAATSTPTPGLPPAAPPGQIGDANCDGAVNSIDAALVLQRGAGLISSLACQDAADVNGDGNVNSIDGALILQYGAGLIDSL